jgi:cytochrome c556
MRIKINRKDRIIDMAFQAETAEDARDLKTAMMAAMREGLTPAAIIAELHRIGYDCEACEVVQ